MNKGCFDCLWFGKECEAPGGCAMRTADDKEAEEYYEEILRENAEEYEKVVREQDGE